MSNPWSVQSLKEEPELLDIMSDELNQRLHIRDFVWVDVPKELTSDHNISSDFTTEVSLIGPTVANIVQSDVDDKNAEEVNKEQSTMNDDEYIDMNESDEFEDMLDEIEFKIDNQRPTNTLKSLYPMPQWLKRQERGTIRTNNTAKNKNDNKVNPLLPKIKFDASTTAVLERLINNRYLGQYNELVGRGKNSFVFHAFCHRRICKGMPFVNAVKVYKLSTDERKNELIIKRVQREYEHLCIVHRLDYSGMDLCPIRAWENVIVMRLIGFESTVSPSIQDLPLHNGRDVCMYLDIVSFMHKCYNVAHLVHGKLCAKNILCLYDVPQFIGWGHSVKTNHPQALAKLIKDCHFVTKFYAERGVKVKTTEERFKQITRSTKISSKLLDVIKARDLYDKYDKNPNRRSPSPMKPNRNLRFK